MFRLDKKMVAVIAIIAILISIGAGTQLQLSIYSQAKEVAIQLGYDEPKNYWILSSVISEREAFKMVLHTEDAEDLDEDTQAQVQSEVGLLFEPIVPFSETDLEPRTETYRFKYWISDDGFARVPAHDINDAGWLTTARYTVSVYKDGNELSKQLVNVNYKEQRVISLETPEGDVTVNNLGMLPQGVEVPSGDLITILDPWDKWHVWAKADYLALLDWWNEEGWVDHIEKPAWFDESKPFSWYEFWNAAVAENKLPSDVKLTHVSHVTYTPDMTYVALHYSDIVFAGDITVYIPSELADTIIVNLYEPIPKIISIAPSPLPTVYEGEDFTLTVTVRNVGTEGTISITITSERYVANPITETFANFKEDQARTFRWQIYALNVEEDTEAELTILAQGRGGTVTETLVGTILDQPGYTPPEPPLPPPPVPPEEPFEFPFWLLIVLGCAIVLFWWYYMRRRH